MEDSTPPPSAPALPAARVARSAFLDNSCDSGERRVRLHLALPYPQDAPSLAPEPPSDAGVPPPVVLDLLAPEFDVALGRPVAARASVPEAAIDERSNLQAGPCKVGLAVDGPLLAIAGKAGLPQSRGQRLLGGLATRALDQGHDPRPDFLRNMVHEPLPLAIAL